jgi:hypothetical protein
MIDTAHEINRMFAGFDPAKHVINKDRCAPQCQSFRLGLAHAYGQNRQVILLSGVRFKDRSNRAEKVHVFREFRSGPGVMGPPEIARGIVGMIEGLARAADIHPQGIVTKLVAYGDFNAEGLGNIGLYNRRIEEALEDLGYPFRINFPVDVAGARLESEALINALVLEGGFRVNDDCKLLIDVLAHHQCGAVSSVINSLRYSLFDVLSAPKTNSPEIRRG